MRLPAAICESRWRIFDWQLHAEFHSKRRKAEELPHLRIAKLRELLRGTPYWSAGHLRLAQESFSENDIAVAFISAQAVLALESKGDRAAEARALQARCYLKRGAIAEAKALITGLLSESPNSAALREDLGAILILENNFAAAVAEFEKISQEKLSGEGLAALQFARGKV